MDLVKEIELDRIFFEESGGGVTLSGGEPLAQSGFVEDLVMELKARGIPVAVDTSGHLPHDGFERIVKLVDMILFDLKLLDVEKHKHYTNVSNHRILANLKGITDLGIPVVIRVPIIPGVNDSDQEMKSIGQFVSSLKNIAGVSLLPYHPAGNEKYRKLKKERFLKKFEAPSQDTINRLARILSDFGFEVTIGG